jgi:CubicO group peptidase (beta-lactamase class C family)
MNTMLMALLIFTSLGDQAGDGTTSAVAADRLARIDAILAPLIHESGPGAALLVLRNDSVLVSRCYGLADVERHIPVTPTTNFRIASVTKQFTATAIMLLFREGKLDLDDSLKRFFPTLRGPVVNATVRHLLTHTSGIIAYEDIIPEGQTRQLTDADVLKLVSVVDTTYFPPGSAYRYSNTGYALLALIVEKLSGMKFADFLRQRIFLPLHMDSTFAHEEGRTVVPQRAYGYSKGRFLFFSWWTKTDQNLTSAVLGDGGIYTSLEDLRRWHRAIDNGTLLDHATLLQMFTRARLNNEQLVDYGFGWRVSLYQGKLSHAHSGSSIGFNHATRRLPNQHLVFILLTNQNDVEASDYLNPIVDLFLTETSEHP